MKFTLNDNNTPIVRDHSLLNGLMHMGEHHNLVLAPVPVTEVSDDELLSSIQTEH